MATILDWIYDTFVKPFMEWKGIATTNQRIDMVNRMRAEGIADDEIQRAVGDTVKVADVPKPDNLYVVAMKALIEGSQGLMKGGLDARGDLETALKPTISEIGKALSDPFLTQITTELPKAPETHSRPDPTAASNAGIAFVTASLGLSVASHIGGMLLDATHPIKEWGLQKIVPLIQNSFGLSQLAAASLSPHIRSKFLIPVERANRESYEESDLGLGVFNQLYLEKKIEASEWHKWAKFLGYPEEQRNLAIKGIHTLIPARTLRMIHRLSPYSDSELQSLLAEQGLEPPAIAKMMLYIKEGSSAQEKVLSIGYWLEAMQKGLRPEATVRDKLAAFGYDAESIQLAIDLHAVKSMDEDKGVLSGEVATLLKNGIILEATAREMWKALRYSEEAIDFKVQLAVWQKTQDDRDAGISVYRNLFTAGRIDEKAFRDKLTALGMGTEGQDAEVANATLKMAEPVAKLTKSEVLESYSKGLEIATDDWTTRRLRDMGVPEEDITVLLLLHAKKVAA